MSAFETDEGEFSEYEEKRNLDDLYDELSDINAKLDAIVSSAADFGGEAFPLWLILVVLLVHVARHW